jgi:hypothetical protein
MKYTIIAILILSSLNSLSQKKIFVAKFCPLALIDDVSFPTIQGGLEFQLKNKITWYNEVGIKYRMSTLDKNVDTNIIKSSGYKLKSEIRYYFRNNGGVSYLGDYLAANTFFTKDYHNNQVKYYHNGDTAQILTDDFGVKREIFGINLVFGHQQKLGKNSLLDYYFGLGFRFRHIKTYGEQFNDKVDFNLNQSIDPNFWAWRLSADADADEWNKTLPNVTAGLRFAFKL